MRSSLSLFVLPLACMLFAGAAVVPSSEAEAKRIRVFFVPRPSSFATQPSKPAANVSGTSKFALSPSDAEHAERAKRKLEAERAPVGSLETTAAPIPPVGTLTCIAGCYGKR